MKEQELAKLILKNLENYTLSIINQQFKQFSNVFQAFNNQQIKSSIEDTRYNLIFLSTAFQFQNPNLFKSYLNWLAKVLYTRNVPLPYLIENLHIMKNFLEQAFPNENEGINRYFDEIDELTNEKIQNFYDQNTKQTELNAKTSSLLNLLVKTQKSEIISLIQSWIDEGITREEFYLNIVQPVLYEIGNLWESNKIFVAHEHYATAIIKHFIEILPKQIQAAPNNENKLTESKNVNIICSCVGTEGHDIGLKILSDFFELEGWNVYYLGANTPNETNIAMANVIKKANSQSRIFFAISLSTLLNLVNLNELIIEIRLKFEHKVGIIIGGRVFIQHPELAQMIDGDLCTADVKAAVQYIKHKIRENPKLGANL